MMCSQPPQSPRLLSVLPESQKNVQHDEVASSREAMDSFTKLIDRSGNSVCLHCIVPTWNYSPDTCLDLHDLHELRSRFLRFIHTVVESLRASGISASYQLAPSDASVCLVCAVPAHMHSSEVKATALKLLQQTRISKRKIAWLAHLDHGPALIMT